MRPLASARLEHPFRMHYDVAMNTITLKDVPSSLHGALKTRAKANGRSLNREIIILLNESVHGARVSPAALLDQARRVRASIQGSLSPDELSRFRVDGRR